MIQERVQFSKILLDKVAHNGIVVDSKGTFKFGSVVVTQKEQGKIIRLIEVAIPELKEELGRSKLLDYINNDTENLFMDIVSGMRKGDMHFLQVK